MPSSLKPQLVHTRDQSPICQTPTDGHEDGELVGVFLRVSASSWLPVLGKDGSFTAHRSGGYPSLVPGPG